MAVVSQTFATTGTHANYAADASMTRCLEMARRAATEELCVAIRAVGDLEAKLGLERAWTEEDRQYQDAVKYFRHHDFHHALDWVQQLVIQ
jgi:hypothetical protein